MLERPDLLQAVVAKHSARDTTARQRATQELEAMLPRPSQDDREHQIPEKSWFYWLVKKFWFNDFGVYKGGHPLARPKPREVATFK